MILPLKTRSERSATPRVAGSADCATGKDFLQCCSPKGQKKRTAIYPDLLVEPVQKTVISGKKRSLWNRPREKSFHMKQPSLDAAAKNLLVDIHLQEGVLGPLGHLVQREGVPCATRSQGKMGVLGEKKKKARHPGGLT